MKAIERLKGPQTVRGEEILSLTRHPGKSRELGYEVYCLKMAMEDLGRIKGRVLLPAQERQIDTRFFLCVRPSSLSGSEPYLGILWDRPECKDEVEKRIERERPKSNAEKAADQCQKEQEASEKTLLSQLIRKHPDHALELMRMK